MAALLSGQSVDVVAQEYNVSQRTVYEWRKEILAATSQGLRNQKKEIGELLAEYLHEAMVTARAQQEHFRDPDWLAKQDAPGLAVLHGVSMDKAVRLFQAAESASEVINEAMEAASGAAE